METTTAKRFEVKAETFFLQIMTVILHQLVKLFSSSLQKLQFSPISSLSFLVVQGRIFTLIRTQPYCHCTKAQCSQNNNNHNNNKNKIATVFYNRGGSESRAVENK